MDEIRRTRAAIDSFNARHRQGERLPLVPTYVEISYRMPAVRGEGPWTKNLTRSQRHFFLWLVESIAAVGGCLVVDFAELEREVGIGKQTLAAAAQVLRDRDLVTVEAEPGTTRFGRHTFRFSPSSAAELLVAPAEPVARARTAGERTGKPAGPAASPGPPPRSSATERV